MIEYKVELEKAIRELRPAFRVSGCGLRREGDVVMMLSPITGAHSLCMREGVRPVSDLYAHAEGFLASQVAR